MTTYRDSVAKIRAMRKELNTNYMIMSQYERQRIEAAIENEVNRARSSVVAGALQEWQQALSSHKAAGRAIDEARRKEAQRWQTDKLGLELQLTRMQFDRCQSVAEVRALYNAGMESHDPVKQRATAEVCAGALSKFPSDRLNAHRLAVEASRAAAELQSTPEIREALERGAEATKRIVDLQTEIGSIAQEVGAFGDTYRELNRVQVRTAYDSDAGRWLTSVEISEGEKVTA
jgi:hypothetical protein